MGRQSGLISPAATLLAMSMLISCGGGGGGGGSPPPPPPPPVNAAPSFNSAATVSVAENTVTVFYTAAATDPEGVTPTYSISGGADSVRFSIDAASGALRFVAGANFEAPNDSNTDNIYEVTLAASDGAQSGALALRVTVTNATSGAVTRRVATGFTQPLFLAGRGDGSGRVFVVEKTGRIRILTPSTGAIAATPFLDVSAQISTVSERGLLGFTLAPDYATSGQFYVFLTNTSGAVEIRRYNVQAGNADVADPASMHLVLRYAHAAGNHNGGWIGFQHAPAPQPGALFIATGDNAVGASAQDVSGFHGKILRIDPRADQFPGDPDRNYADVAGVTPGHTWFAGLRNPWRASFDRATNNLYIGDVGENTIEEINFAQPDWSSTGSPPRSNYGWPTFEGNAAGAPSGTINPIAQYTHGTGPLQGESVTGGYVYRGPVTALQGQYVFADYISDRIFAIPAGDSATRTQFPELTTQFIPTNAGTIANIASFGEDDAANLYIIDLNDGEIFMVVEGEPS